jgi:hypothetical protein
MAVNTPASHKFQNPQQNGHPPHACSLPHPNTSALHTHSLPTPCNLIFASLSHRSVSSSTASANQAQFDRNNPDFCNLSSTVMPLGRQSTQPQVSNQPQNILLWRTNLLVIQVSDQCSTCFGCSRTVTNTPSCVLHTPLHLHTVQCVSVWPPSAIHTRAHLFHGQ